jgi:hypothetical protein
MLKHLLSLAAIGFLLMSCDSPLQPDTYDYTLHVNLESDIPIAFNDSSKINIKVWGYSRFVADAPATNLITLDTTISSINQVYTLSFRKEDFERVTYRSGQAGEFGYYFSLNIDMNGDGQICSGDYRQDFDKTDIVFFDESDTGEKSLAVYITRDTSGICFPLSPVSQHDAIPDSLLSGSYLGLAIGESSTAIYNNLQQLYNCDSIGFVMIVGNIFTNAGCLAYLVPLYTEVLCDDTIRSDSGLQFTFAGDTLKSIYHNNGMTMGSWPNGVGADSIIRIGDPRSMVANKLLKLSGNARTGKELKVFRLFQKDLSTPADTFMLGRAQWYFAREIANDTILETDLYFQDKVLFKIKNVKFPLYRLP